MAVNTITVGRQARLKIGSDTYCFGRFNNKTTREVVTNRDGTICGDTAPPINRARKGRKLVFFDITIDFTYAGLVKLVPWLGLTDLTGGIYEQGAADELVEKAVSVDFGATGHDFTNVIVMAWSIRASKGGRPPQLTINCCGEDETEWVSSFANAPITVNDVFSFTDLSIFQIDNAAGTLTTRTADRMLIQVDNSVVGEHNNSITRTGAKIGDWKGVFATSVPYIVGHKDLYWNLRDSEGPVEAVVKMTNGDGSIRFDMLQAFPITQGPSVLSKVDQIRTPVTLDLHRGDNAGSRVSPIKITLTIP